MAVQKTDQLVIGSGALNSNAQAAQIFASVTAVSSWDSSLTYSAQSCVESAGKIYRSLVSSNINNNPSSSPAYWEPILKNVKDGDACFVIDGAFSDLMIRANGLWQSLGHKPYSLSLNDNQASPLLAFSYLGTALPYASIEIRIRRNNSYSSASKDTYELMNDGTTALRYSVDGISIGSDTGVTITPIINAGVVEFQYTSTNLGQAITLEYTLRGF